MMKYMIRYKQVPGALLGLLVGLALYALLGGPALLAKAGNNGTLTVEIIAGKNLVVDSNVTSPSTYAPSVATVMGKFCNTSSSITLENVTGYIGNYNGASSTPGIYPARVISHSDYAWQDDGTTYSYSFNHVGGALGTKDAARFIGSLGPGECQVQYWSFTYPRCENNAASPHCSKSPVWGETRLVADDLWLDFDIWVTGYDGATAVTSFKTSRMTMRNEISAMANKIEPNPNGRWFNTNTSTIYVGDLITSNGVLYDLGVINQGFDNPEVDDNGNPVFDGTPDYNAWMQPFGSPTYDPSCFRLIRTTGVLTVSRSAQPPMVVNFTDKLFFPNLPPDNNGAIGNVRYTFMALRGGCSTDMTPYQEVASGSENEKFNADFGASIPPVASASTTVSIDKSSSPNVVATGGTTTYSIPVYNAGSSEAGRLTLGTTDINMPVVISDTVPAGMSFVGNSATIGSWSGCTGCSATIRVSTDSGQTWGAEPASDVASSSPANLVVIQWWLDQPLPAGASAIASFQAKVPATAPNPPYYSNCAGGSLGNGAPFDTSCTNTVVKGLGSLGDLIWRDEDHDGLQDSAVGEPGLSGVTVRVYLDINGNGKIDSGEPQVNAVTKNVINGKLDLDGSGVADDNGEFDAYNVIGGLIDINGDNAISDADDGMARINGYNIINGYIDMDGDGSVTLPDSGDDGVVSGTTTASRNATITNGVVTITSGASGTFAGYTLIGGLVDLNGDGAITTADSTGALGDTIAGYNIVNGYVGSTSTNATLSGIYGVTGLPNGSYVVQVTTTDTDIPTGYTPTTAREALVTLTSGAPNSRSADFGFGPTLKLQKTLLSRDPGYVGDTISFRINLINQLSGDGTAVARCQYTVWAETQGTNTTYNGPTPAWTNPANAVHAGGPDGLYASKIPSTNPDDVTGTGINLSRRRGNITKVEALYSVYVNGDFTNDELAAHYWHSGNVRTTGPLASSVLNAYAGGPEKQGVFAWDITNLDTWSWTNFTGTTLEVGFEAKKSGSEGGDATIFVDAMGFRITTDQSCSGADRVIASQPLVDTYDASKLQFLAAIPAPTTAATGGTSPYANTGTLTWDSLGPIYPGGIYSVTVYFKALATTSTATVNKASASGGRFATGASVNTPPDATASTNIVTSYAISGKTWIDVNGNGWSGTTGYDAIPATDQALPNTLVELNVCRNPVTSLNVTTSPNQSCVAAGYEWIKIASAYTDLSGNYSFSGLQPGYYNVVANNGNIPTGFTTRTAEASGAANGAGTTTTDGAWNEQSTTLSNLTYLSSANITQVNFGYRNTATNSGTVTGYVWNDADRDNTWDNGEPPIPGTTVTLYCTGSSCAQASYTTTTDDRGFYSFTNLPTGTNATYYVAVTKPDNMEQSGDPEGGACYGNTSTCNNQTATFTLSANGARGPDLFGYDNGITIGDTVFTDWNGNGVQGDGDAGDGSHEGEAGISGVQVNLYRDVDANGIFDPLVDLLIATQTTDSSGNYSFTDVPGNGSDYLVRVVKSTLPAGYRQTGDPEGGCPSGAACDGMDVITNIGGSNYTLADFGYQPRGLGGLGDFVWMDSDGDGVQDTGESGKGGVTIDLYRDANGDGIINPANDALVASATTTHYAVVNGCVDVDGDGDACTDDTSLDPGVQGIKVYYGRLDMDGDGRSTYKVINGAIDIDGNGSITAADNAISLFSTRIIAGLVDLNGDGVANDNGTYQGYPVIAGRLDLDNNLTANDNSDWAISGQSDDGVLGPYSVVDGLLDMNGDGNITAADDGSLVGFYWFSNLADASYIVQVRAAEFVSGGDLVGYALTNAGAAYDHHEVSYKTTLLNNTPVYTADFGFATTVIGDYIWMDNNANGTPDASEAGINGVTIKLYEDLNNDGDHDDAGETSPLATATTANDATTGKAGYYRFEGWPPGDYILEIDPAEFLLGGTLYNFIGTYDPDAWNVPCVGTSASGCDAKSMLTDPTSGYGLKASQVDLSNDFGFKPAMFIGDFVWIDSDGDGVQDAGEPGLANVLVTLDPPSGVDLGAGDGVAISTYTDSDGYYSFGNLGTGTGYTISAAAVTDMGRTYDADSGTSSPDGVVSFNVSGSAIEWNGSDANDCSLSTACNPQLDFGYKYTTATPFSLEGFIFFDDDHDGGIYNSSDGNLAIGNVSVYLYRCSDSNCASRTLVGETTTDATSGAYSFTGLPPAYYMVAADYGSPKLKDLTLTYEPDETDDTDGPHVDDGDVYCGTGSFSNTSSPGCNATTIINLDKDTSHQDFGFYAEMDCGDLPDSYSYKTSVTMEGPCHVKRNAGTKPTIWLGTNWDYETNGQGNLLATGDDSGSDDEDGIDLGAWQDWAPGDSPNIHVDVSGSNAYLAAWIDWNLDGNFANGSVYDTGEYIYFGQVGPGTDIPLRIDIPSAAAIPTCAQPATSGCFRRTKNSQSYTTLFARFRLLKGASPPPVISPTGSVTDGEVEDYYQNNYPTAVTLADFSARSSAGQVVVNWQSAVELRSLGYNIYRSTSLAGQRTQLNADLIPAEIGSMTGAAYQFVDPESGFNRTSYYWLEAVGADGSQWYGPVTVTTYGIFLPLTIR